jgi:hypothetical protein
VVALLGVLAVPAAADACSCVSQPPAQQLRQADGAVVARLVAVRPIGGQAALQAKFVYRTGLVVKGAGLERGRRLVLRGSTSSAACGLSTDVGGLSGLFLHRSGGRWGSSLCGQTARAVMRRLARGAEASSATPPCAR